MKRLACGLPAVILALSLCAFAAIPAAKMATAKVANSATTPPPKTCCRSGCDCGSDCSCGQSCCCNCAGRLERLRKDIVAPSVTVRDSGGMGAGTIITLRGRFYVLTAGHMVEDSPSVSVARIDANGKSVTIRQEFAPLKCTLADGREFKARPAWVSHDKPDLALLSIDNDTVADLTRTGLRAAVLYAGLRPEVGTEAYTIGSPGRLEHSLDKTVINQADEDTLVVNGNVWYGSSGGGVFVWQDGRYRLVGVVVCSAGRSESPKVPGRCERRLREFLDSFKECAK